MTIAVTSSTMFALVLTVGCVMQSTYDTALQDTVTTRTELARALEEQKTLTRQVTDMELQNAEAVREAEAAVAVLRQAKDEADHERQQIEQQFTRLRQKLAQATKQQHALKYELTVAKENGAALQEMIDVYEQKLQNGSPAAEPAVHKPFDPSTIPVPQDLPPAPAAAAPTPMPAPTPAAAPAPTPANAARPSADEGWLSNIKNWLVSLWQSVFS